MFPDARFDAGFEKEGGHHRKTGDSGKGLDYLYSSPCFTIKAQMPLHYSTLHDYNGLIKKIYR